MRKKTTRLLLVTILVGAVLRLYQLDQIPNSMSADEAAFGYNAYSILKTGRDEFGHFLPLYLQSFDDNKNPVFGYLLLPFIYVWGLTDWAIRLPSSLAGIGVILLSYLVTWEITRNRRLSLLTGLFASISPWLIQYSRVAIEMELALFLSLAAVWAFLKALRHPGWYIPSVIFLGISFYTYYSSKLWAFVFGLVLFLLYFKQAGRRYLWGSIILFLILTVPYFLLVKSAKLGIRPYAVSVFANRQEHIDDTQMNLYDSQNNIWGGRIIHNRRFVYLNQAVNGYLEILNPRLLFGQSKYNQIPSTRLFYLWQLPLIGIGVYYLVKKPKRALFIISWWLIALIPGGLTVYAPLDRRILLASLPLLFLAAYGLVSLSKIRISNSDLFQKVLKIGFTAVVTGSVYFYVHHYFIHGPLTVVDTWGNGSKEIVETVSRLKQNYETVYISIRSNQPHTFFLYYLKYPPDKFLQEGGTVSGGYLDERNHFDSFRFKIIRPQDMAPKSLYVWHVSETQPCLAPFKTIYMTDGQPLVYLGVFDDTRTGCAAWRKAPPSV